MDVVIYDILLDTQYAGCRRQIELKKGEANSKTFRIELCKGTEPIAIDPKETIAIIKGYKEDGTVIFNSAKITDESKIEYEVGSQDTAAVGTTWYEVQLVAVIKSFIQHSLKLLSKTQWLKMGKSLHQMNLDFLLKQLQKIRHGKKTRIKN